MNKRIFRDIILIVVLLAVAGVLMIFFSVTGKDGSFAVITVNGEVYKTVSLDSEAEIDVNGLLTVVISEGKAYVKDTVCIGKICQNHRPISRAGETIACLPNGITIKITGESNIDFII